MILSSNSLSRSLKVFALLATLAASSTAAQTAPVTSWLASRAVPLDMSGSSFDVDELQPLGAVLRSKKVVAVGEASHGSHEMFVAKHRLFRFLAQEAGFTTLGLEAGFVECLPINRYIHTGEGDPAQLIAALKLWPWRTKELLDVVQWMRAYNVDATHARKLSFVGIDSGNGMILGFPALKAYFQTVDPEFSAQIDAAQAFVNDPARARMRDQGEVLLRAIEQRLDRRRADYVARSSHEAFRDMRHAAAVVRQNYDFYFVDIVYEARDRHMAQNVIWALDQEGAAGKIMVWGHNAHVSRDPAWYAYDPDIDWRKIQPMGAHLARTFDEALYVIGAEFVDGTFRAPAKRKEGAPPSIQAFTVPPAPVGSLPTYLTDLPTAFIDFSEPPRPGIVSRWLETPILADNYGGATPDETRSLTAVKLGVSYDGLLSFRHSTPSIPLPTP